MHVKNADLHVSYAAPVRVSDTNVCFGVAARAVTFCVAPTVAARFTTFDDVARVVTDCAVARLTVLRTGTNTLVRPVVARSVIGVVEIRFWVPRCVALPSRTAPSACDKNIAIAIIKLRIFFISDESLAKFAKSGQAKYGIFI